jgi:pimeloyl-ACP methyl ester carboxylesterase
MARFLLIHGSAHGAWCWRDLTPLLEAAGHEVYAIDLPSHGDDKTPYQKVTLAQYGARITTELDAISTPVILVGHSMGGYPITLAAEQRPDLVSHLVYLCAYVPKPGFSLNDRRREAPEQPLMSAIQLTTDGLGWTVADHDLPRLFYHDCSADVLEFARKNLTIQAREPSSQAVELTKRSAQIPRSYIRCLNDGTIPPAYQVTMSQDWPSARVFSMDCGHSPFFADPHGLAGHLNTIANDTA